MAVKTRTRRIYVKAKKKRYRQKPTVSLAVVAGMVPALGAVWADAKRGAWSNMGNTAVSIMTGYTDGKFIWSKLKFGLLPMVGGFVAHKIATKIGLNRLIAKSKIPLVRI